MPTFMIQVTGNGVVNLKIYPVIFGEVLSDNYVT